MALVLLYHAVTEQPLPGLHRWAVTPQTFARHVDLVAASGRPVRTFDELCAARASGSREDDTVVITFDDGYADNLAAAEVLRRSGMAATLFVTTGAVGRPGMLGAEDLAALHRAGWEIGSHGVTHRRLDELTSPEIIEEVVGSRGSLREWLGVAPTCYAYPHGNHDRRVLRATARAGYLAAAAVRESESPARDHPFRVARRTVLDCTGADVLTEWLHGRGVRGSHRPRPERVMWRAYRRLQARRSGYVRDELAEALARPAG